MDQVNTKATFSKDDRFKRQSYMIMCEKLIKNHPAGHSACTIAVDAPWGVGKSTLLWMWINDLNKQNSDLLKLDEEARNGRQPILPIYYNAWESDYCDSALAPLLYSICAMVEKTKDDGWLLPENDELLTEFISSCGGLLTSLLYFHFSGDTTFAPSVGAMGQVATKGLLSLFKRYMHKDIEDPDPGSIGAAYDKQLEAREQFRDALSELAQKFGGVYIFIDELDRCNPSFAIDTLEAIKHYFDIPGLTFIFGVDMEQLGHAIGGRYGGAFDADGYLSKFFDHRLTLSTPTSEQMLQYSDPSIFLNADTYIRLNDIFRACNVTPREIPRIVKASKTLLNILWAEIEVNAKDPIRDFIFLLVSMKTKRTTVCNRYLNSENDWNQCQWDQNHSFFSFLSFFFPYLSMSSSDCLQSWKQIIWPPAEAPVSDEKTVAMAAIGRSIVYCVHPRESTTFGRCLSLFLDQVYV